MKLSAHNQIKGSSSRFARLDDCPRSDRIGDGVIITSSITDEAVDDLGLRVR